jgi:hypothetical protein
MQERTKYNFHKTTELVSKRQLARERKQRLKDSPKWAQMSKVKRMGKKADDAKPSWYGLGIAYKFDQLCVYRQRELNRYKQLLNAWHELYKELKEEGASDRPETTN